MKISIYAFFAALIFTAVISTPEAAFAAAPIPIYFNGNVIQSDVPPEIVNNRVMVPLRVISEGFDAEVAWDANTQTITVQQSDLINTLKIGGETASYVTNYGKKTIRLDSPPYIKKDRTMAPLRYVAESLNLDVEWNADEKAVYINTPKPLPATAPLNFHAYREMGRFSCGLAAVIDDNGKLGYVDVNGNLIIPFQFDTTLNDTDYSKPDYLSFTQFGYNATDFYVFSKFGYAYVKQNGEYFYIDTTGKKIDNTFSGKYYSAGPFVNGRAAARLTKGGLFGYIDTQGNPITEFKYLSASNFKDGAAKGILLVQAAGTAQLQPDDWRMVFDEYYGYPYPIQGFSDPLPLIGDSMAMMDVYLDINGNVLQTKPHEPAESDFFGGEAYFRSGVIFELYEVSNGLILEYKDSSDGTQRQYRYVNLDGTPAIVFDKSLNVFVVTPFDDEGYAKVIYIKDDLSVTGYINKKGEILDNEKLADENPELFTDIQDCTLDPRGIGTDAYIEYRNGSQYLVQKQFYDEMNIEYELKLHREFYYTEPDGRIRYDCNDAVRELFVTNIPDFDIDILNYLQASYTAYIEKQTNTNIYYLIWHPALRNVAKTVGFFTLDLSTTN